MKIERNPLKLYCGDLYFGRVIIGIYPSKNQILVKGRTQDKLYKVIYK